MSEWDDLFAKAEGRDTSRDAENGALPSGATSGRKRSLGQRRQEAHRAYLAGRWSVAPSWPPHLELRGALAAAPQDCTGYAAAQPPDGVAGCEPCGGDCRRCGRPAWRHWAAVAAAADDDVDALLAPLICALRNARCAAIQAAIMVASGKQLEANYSRCLKRVLRHWKRQSSSGVENIEGDLRDKQQKVAQHIVELITDVSNPSSSRNKMHESAMRLVMACDAVYYHTYYQQLTMNADDPETETRDMLVLPHPVSYFGLIASPSMQQKRLMVENQLKLLNVTPSIQERWGLDSSQDDEQHPLQVVHYHRLMETLCCFRNVPFSLSALSRRPLGAHETPAPDLLMDWRDSCRDYLCHLYAYATIPPRAIRRIVDLARPEEARQGKARPSILELGAGTGYLAKILKRKGIDVQAFDVCPTTPESEGKLNEYHGQTPSFTCIQQGDERVLLQQKKIGNSILMLCYPPPDSEFARKAIGNFMQRGGGTIVFIGEFKGLTGSTSMEQLMQQEFDCKERIPCYSWGPDASLVSVWTRRMRSEDVVSDCILVPCSVCQVKESTKRLRLLRFLTYCSYGCFRKGAEALETHLKLASVPIAPATLEFENATHFSSLKKIAS